MREGDETFQIIFYVQKLHLSGGEKLDLLKSVWKVQAHTFHTHTHTHTHTLTPFALTPNVNNCNDFESLLFFAHNDKGKNPF
jgi:hypothetical protein